jgi:hypothetical protein
MIDITSRFITITNDVEDKNYIIVYGVDSERGVRHYKLYSQNFNQLLIDTSSAEEFFNFFFQETQQNFFEEFFPTTL